MRNCFPNMHELSGNYYSKITLYVRSNQEIIGTNFITIIKKSVVQNLF